MSSRTRQQLEEWIKTIEIDVGSRILDVGGAQKPARDRITRGGMFEYTILDLEEPHENSPKPDIVCDLNEVNDIHTIHNEYSDCWREPKINSNNMMAPNFKGQFDYVLCFEVAEYWWNPYRALKNIAWFLMLSQ